MKLIKKGVIKIRQEGLVKFRKSLELTQKSMSEKIGVSLSLYRQVEYGDKNPSFGFMTKFTRAFPEFDMNIFLKRNDTKSVVKEE